MTYKIVEIDIENENIAKQVNKLLGHTFGSDSSTLTEGKLKENTFTNGENQSLYLAAIENNEVIGFNAFISHTFYLNSKTINCYQSCWTATSIEHRGKKVFQNIIEEAKKVLTSRKAGFIFGFPNENSQPIFTKKLGFKETPSIKINIPNILFLIDLYFNKNVTKLSDLNQDSILQNDTQLYKLKKKAAGSKLIKSELNGSFIWGVIRSRKVKGIKLLFFDVGGVEIKNIENVPALFKKVSKTHKFSFFQIVMTKNNLCKQLFKKFEPANTNDLIIYDLDLDTSTSKFNFWGGIKDVY